MSLNASTNLSTNASLTVAEVLRKEYRTILVLVSLVLCVLWVSLTAYVINNVHRRITDGISSWVSVHKPKLEEALYLHNFISLGVRVAQSPETYSHLVDYRITVFDNEKKPLVGTGSFPEREALGFSQSISRLSTVYFDMLQFAGRTVGYLNVETQIRWNALLLAGGAILFLCCGLFLILRKLLQSFLHALREKLISPILALEQGMNDFQLRPSGSAAELTIPPQSPAEIRLLYEGYQNLMERVRYASQFEVKKAEVETALRLAQQVAHDIRSPLVALRMALQELKDTPESQRNLIRLATNRIHEIANNLVEKHSSSPSNGYGEGALETAPIYVLIHEIVVEKQCQYQDRPHIRLTLEGSPDSYSFFAKVQVREFKRVLSNLINNAFEAFPGGQAGEIDVHVSLLSDRICVLIRDSGAGIPAHVLPHLTESGFTFGKVGGTGLGLSHAKTTMESWGGELKIQSETNQGTSIFLFLPRSVSPEWFAPSLELPSNGSVVVVDDDPSVHAVWRERLQSMTTPGKQIQVSHFSTVKDFENYLSVDPSRENLSLFLVDYEFKGEKTNGIDLIEQFKLNQHAILVTARYDEGRVKQACSMLHLKCLPKSLVPFIPIHVVH